ncbi:SGNH/GDSL hydrolase family protein [Pedobacter nyackensis]|uniref:Lysophospholipase L1 n=1 Tax=Pedobacter nyackensis TaxID=475255 RepID=A0A1W2EM60_9SPHI|nr:SGNH/GDSL hydrolase family protein [Pedobacter nyackensis]SMD10218.1 Lysophospholipase L1 [Pedobacter nyackensis]
MDMTIKNERRTFLKTVSVGGLISLVSPALLSAAPTEKKAKIALSENDIILFQGDSITDAGRSRDSNDFNNAAALGRGYAFLAACELLNKHADKNLKIYNRGISGNKVYQLAERWDKECLELKPTVLSILIGVNDYWHKHSGKYSGTSKVYQDAFRKLLDTTREKLPDVKLIIAEPFAVNKVKAVDDTWYPEFNEYRVAALEIAKEFKAAWIPLQKVFDDAGKRAPGKHWTGDGVHPSPAGAQLMANAWLEVLK